MTGKTAHLISHSHWDREWYMPYEYHHVLLSELMNELLDTLEQDERYRSFHLDGQTIIVEDYLQVHPEKRETLEKFIREGRIIIGPWYVLQDEFLTSSEANVRNLLIGHQDAAHYGVISKLGYFPDSFGNMGQAPQMLKQADIDTAVFGRGVKPTGFDNMIGESTSTSYESPYSEMFWASPDGSTVMKWQGESLALSAFKMSQQHEDIILRWYNLAHKSEELKLETNFPLEGLYSSDILERQQQRIELTEEGNLHTTVGKAQIITYALSPVQQ